jgi:RNA polymerase sigma-70 factor (ECF subfamily)
MYLEQASDEELLVSLQVGGHDAFTQIYHRYKNVLVIHAYKKLGNVDDAKEIVQDVFSSLWNNHASLPVVKNVSGYLYTLVRNRVLNFIEHKRVELRYSASFDSFKNEKHYELDLQLREKEMQAIINKEIDALPPRMREVFILSRKAHLTHKEIAEKLDISEHTVKNHIKGALKILRARLGLFSLIIMHYLL